MAGKTQTSAAIPLLAEKSPAPEHFVAVATAGLIAGTRVMTIEGEVPVEDLAPGARIISRDAGLVVLRGIGSGWIQLAPTAIKAGALGHTRPRRDMLVPPQTLVHLRDWRAEVLIGSTYALVPSKLMIDDDFVFRRSEERLTVFELMFDRHHIIYADGIEIATASV